MHIDTKAGPFHTVSGAQYHCPLCLYCHHEEVYLCSHTGSAVQHRESKNFILFLAVDVIYRILLYHFLAKFSVRTTTTIRYDGTRELSILLQVLRIGGQQLLIPINSHCISRRRVRRGSTRPNICT